MGALLVAVSATAFGAMPIFGVRAYADGTSTWALLTVRFGVAAAVMAVVLRARGIPLPDRRRWLPLSAMGLGYVGQSACYFSALHYAQASLVALLLYLFPAFVAVLAAVFLRERLTLATAAAIGLSLAGTALVVGGGSGRTLGILLGVGAAVIYSVYIVVGTVVTAGLHPLALTTVICTAAAALSALVTGVLWTQGDPPAFPGSVSGWAALAAIAVVCSVVAIMAFFSGLQRLGATQTAVLSTLEPVVTVALASWLLAESLTGVQLLGGLVVLAAVVWQALSRRPVGKEDRGLALEAPATPPA